MRRAGTVAAAPFGAVAALRGAKALHPRGAVVDGRLIRTGCGPAAGWLGEPGEDAVLIRFSRSAGLPRPLPDVLGLALRLPTGDLLLSSAGAAPGARHLLRPGRDPLAATYTSLVPLRGPAGPVMVAALPLPSRDGFTLGVARPTGAWHRAGTLRTPSGALVAAAPDADVDFDPVRRPVPGLLVAGRLARVRAAAYAASRAGRRGRGGGPR